MKILPVNNSFKKDLTFEKKVVIKPTVVRNTLMGMAFLSLFATDCILRCSDYKEYKQKIDSLIEVKKDSDFNVIRQNALVEYVLSKSNIYGKKWEKVKDCNYSIKYLPNMGIDDYKDKNYDLKVSTLLYDKNIGLRIKEIGNNKFVSDNKFYEIKDEENGDFLINFYDSKNKIKETKHYFSNGVVKTEIDLKNEQALKRKKEVIRCIDEIQKYDDFKNIDNQTLINFADNIGLSGLNIKYKEDGYELNFKINNEDYSLSLEKLKNENAFVGILEKNTSDDLKETDLIKIEYLEKSDLNKIKLSIVKPEQSKNYHMYTPNAKNRFIKFSKDKEIIEYCNE